MRQIPRLLLVLNLLLLSNYCYSQNLRSDTLFIPPLKIPLYLSGTFAELRSNHFHGGLDIKTQGKIGQPVYAVADGYISRIKIQSGGYGRTLYISHPNGYTTVYAHLSRFTPAVNEYVKGYQYSVQRYEVNIYPPKNKFSYKKGEMIAHSGNSGRSGGPHLHFEIRNSLNQVPQNGLLYNFPIEDKIKPKVYHLAVYPKSFNSHVDFAHQKKIIPLKGLSDTIALNDTIPIYGLIGLGVETYDYSDNSANPCGVFSIELEVDDQLIYKSKLDEVSFGETRYINSLIDYEEKQLQKIKLQKLFRDPTNKLSIYDRLVNNGIFEVNDSLLHRAQINIADAYGNQTIVKCVFKGHPWDSVYQIQDTTVVAKFLPNQANSYSNSFVNVSLPAKTLYDSIHFKYQQIPDTNNPWSDIHQVHTSTTPAHKYFTVGIIPKTPIPEKLKPKTAVCIIDEEDTSSVESRWENNMLMGRTRNFGMYTIKIDTLAPTIEPISFMPRKNLNDYEKISFKITDNMSDIDSYNGYIDGNWVLFEYDAKNDLLYFEMDPTKFSPGKEHMLELYVSDGLKNTATYHASFYY